MKRIPNVGDSVILFDRHPEIRNAKGIDAKVVYINKNPNYDFEHIANIVFEYFLPESPTYNSNFPSIMSFTLALQPESEEGTYILWNEEGWLWEIEEKKREELGKFYHDIDEAGNWHVFHTEGSKSYASYSTHKEAQEDAEERNRRGEGV